MLTLLVEKNFKSVGLQRRSYAARGVDKNQQQPHEQLFDKTNQRLPDVCSIDNTAAPAAKFTTSSSHIPLIYD
ncbi:hypothetical protein T4A_501 [Trichinella pseudospiralis]|uniref:Uncharacterized protein n=2 Tax=Trichinella TaxID=6333 RepID=A0A0V1JS81_TRIPS|nr:hypothetical protein T4A_501 [Trichinella pseudospiralis]KRZ37840.1 hypothetical protein T4C_4388 [Trichinella pseudospiralis]KRZ69534.1 hypothetical protein T10_4430 [Trichinella papuae]